MKTKLLLTVALIGAAALSAQAGVRFGVSFGVPVPVVVTAQVAPVVVTAPVVVESSAAVIPACPGPDYIWVPGYWTVNGYSRVWVAGGWQHHPAHVEYHRPHDRRR